MSQQKQPPANHAREFDRATDDAYAYVDRLNRVTDCASYIESMDRPRSDTYVVMPDGIT